MDIEKLEWVSSVEPPCVYLRIVCNLTMWWCKQRVKKNIILKPRPENGSCVRVCTRVHALAGVYGCVCACACVLACVCACGGRAGVCMWVDVWVCACVGMGVGVVRVWLVKLNETNYKFTCVLRLNLKT